jgi:hypothetical protein
MFEGPSNHKRVGICSEEKNINDDGVVVAGVNSFDKFFCH